MQQTDKMMLRSWLNVSIISLMVFLSSVGVFAQVPGISKNPGPILSGGLSVGYDIGMPIQAQFMVRNLASGLPLTFRLFTGNSFFLDPGNAEGVRQVFVNEATNGVPEKSATRWTFGLDVMHPVNILGLKNAYLEAGMRYSVFTGTFQYVGGDELFDVHCNQIGFGLGLDSYYRVSSRVDLVLSVGTDFYLPAALEGHDATYNPNGTFVNQREQFTYADADKVVNQPKVLPKLAVGFNYGF